MIHAVAQCAVVGPNLPAPAAYRWVARRCMSACAGTQALRLPPRVLFVARSEQRRAGVFSSAATGPIQALHADVEEVFNERSQGSPRTISTAQLVQMLFEVGAVNLQASSVDDVMDFLMQHGFYKQTHSQKRDSYGPAPVPSVGLDECKRWATLLFATRLKNEERAVKDRHGGSNKFERRPRPWIACGANGSWANYAIATKSWESASE